MNSSNAQMENLFCGYELSNTKIELIQINNGFILKIDHYDKLLKLSFISFNELDKLNENILEHSFYVTLKEAFEMIKPNNKHNSYYVKDFIEQVFNRYKLSKI
jgi:hypothetical protein